MNGYKKKAAIFVLSAISAAVLMACGGGGGSGDVASESPVITSESPVITSLSGVAATGTAMAGAAITVTDVNGVSSSRAAGSDGAFSIDISSMTAPFVVTATRQTGGTVFTLTSVVADKPAAGTTGTANVTPIANAMAALLAPNGNPDELSKPDVLKTSVTKEKVGDVKAKVLSVLEAVLAEAGLSAAAFDPVSTVFTANRTGADRVLEMVHVEITGQGVAFSNPMALDDGTGSSSVQITLTAAPTGKLASAPAGTVLGELDHIATLLETCMADAPAVRATAKSADGVPTALSAACNAVPFSSSYLSSGSSAKKSYAGLLTGADYTGAKFDKPEILFTRTDGRVFYRLSYQTAAGEGGVITDTAEKTSPAGKSYKWEVVGNQRIYNSTVEARLDNINQLNPNSAQESSKSQYRVSLRLFFDPTNAAGKTVQAVRVKGPGLPVSGVVMHRSSQCGANDYMTITNKTGALVNSSNRPIVYNSGTATNFKLAVESKAGTFDWSKIRASSSARDTAMSDAELAAIPSFAEYTWELWTFGTPQVYRSDITNSTPPDVTYTQRITSRPPAVGSLKSLPWNSVTASDFLNPASALATSQTSATVNWKATAEPVDAVTVFGQKNVAAVGATPASFVRVSADSSASGVKISDTSKTVAPGTETTGLASLAGITGVTLPSLSCSNVPFPALDAVVGTKDGSNNPYGTYREQVIRSRTSSLARKYVVNSWSNFID